MVVVVEVEVVGVVVVVVVEGLSFDSFSSKYF